MKKKVLFSNFIFILFVVSISFLLFSLIYSSAKKSSLKDLTEEKELFEKSEKEFTTLRSSMKDWDNVEREYLEFKDNLVLRFEDFSKFRKNLELAIRKNSLSKNKFGLEYKRVLGNEFIKVRINMKLKGAYGNLKRFIYDIRKIEKIVYFRSIRMSGSGSGLMGDFKMEVYLVR
ncbi:MAG: type 4a pilus biogenesis protein PilO [Acidobacteriota bacterium]